MYWCDWFTIVTKLAACCLCRAEQRREVTSTFPIIDNTQCSGYMRRVKAALPRSLSPPSHNIEGGNKNNGAHSTGPLRMFEMCNVQCAMCIHEDALKQYLVKVIINN